MEFLIIPAVIILVVYILSKGILIVREKEVMIIERLGRYSSTLTSGVHFVIPIIDRPKTFGYRYYETDSRGNATLKEAHGLTRVSTQNEVIDFPRQNVITRDNASVYLDAVLSYKINSPYAMMYSSQNLPYMLSKLLQAQLRNVAGELDIDQIIEESASLNRLSGLMDAEARRWGVQVVFVRMQRVEAMELSDVLARKKNADLKNQEIIIGAKATRQTAIINAEGQRLAMVRKAEGAATEMVSRARGQAQAILNAANAEARSVREIARVVARAGENPGRYLLSLKYISALKDVLNRKGTMIQFLPTSTSFIQTAQSLGLNAVMPRS